jgi:sarcosine oxidase subunit alpha
MSSTSGPYRLPTRPSEEIDRTKSFTFSWNGTSVSAYEGDTIVSALLAGGHEVIARGLKYHRPRGVLSATFHDPNCTVQVGDEPNVRAAHRLARSGMSVQAQNVFPSLKFDVGTVNQAGSRFLTAGFYYKTFMWPGPLWPTYEKVLSRFAPGGRVAPNGTAAPHDSYDHKYVHPDVLVAGAGPAGISAALAAAAAGADVLLVEEDHFIGGHLRYGGDAEQARLVELRTAVAAETRITVLTNSVVAGRYDDNWVSVVQRTAPGVIERLIKARVGVLVVAPGLFERPYVFENNDLPGVMLSSAARRLIKLYGIAPGRRAVVFTANADGDAAVEALRGAGVEIAAVVDARTGGNIVRALGRGHLTGVELSGGRTVKADLLVTAVGWTAPTSLINMAGARPVWNQTAARFLPGDDLPANVLVAGGLGGDGALAELIEHAAQIGALAAQRASGGAEGVAPRLGVAAHPALFRSSTHGFIDYTEDVKSKDIFAAAAEGYDSSELVKRFTTATMGPSQGKFEVINTIAVLGEAVGASIGDLGTTVWRPPFAPISLGALAGHHSEPVRISPMQEWHDAHGAEPLIAGQWIRPEHYGDPTAEVNAVRSGVTSMMPTPLGKLDLRGPDVPKLLNLVYVNSWNKLDVGSVRYGVMCAEDGVVMDDGVTGRLGENQYLMSTTSSGAATVWEWLENWLQTEHPDWQVHITPVTTSFASINIAGPKSRELMSRLVSDVDLSNEAFPYMKVRQGTIAGVANCVLWRIGFTGELSYEIHVPASYGLHVWESLLEAGADLGVRPFGIEAQRVLRLEKGHFIVAQDTDALTKGFSAGIDSLIKLEKPDYFSGKSELAWQTTDATDGTRVVPVLTDDPNVVPPEASQIVVGTKIAGRITSSRMSPTLKRSIALAQVPVALSAHGSALTIVLPSGNRVSARVFDGHAFVDPEGERLRG